MNTLIQWKEDYNLNIKNIDQQHRKLIDLINILYDSIAQQENDRVLDEIMSDLIDYTFIHFKNEERYFIKFQYDDAQFHIAEHQFFLRQVEKLQAEHTSKDLTVKLETVLFLQKWFLNHILKSDKKYGEVLIRGGMK